MRFDQNYAGIETTHVPEFGKAPVPDAESGRIKPVRTADGSFQRRKDGSVRHASRAYMPTDPAILIDRLQERGFKVGRMANFRSIWRFGLEVIYPEADCGPSSEYGYRAKILCGNTGREALQIAPGALRFACMNQFHADVVHIRHTDSAIVDFMSDPATTLFGMRDMCQGIVDRLNGLRGLKLPIEYGFVLTEAHPRIGQRVIHHLVNYRHQSGDFGKRFVDAWDLCQALTEVKQPRTVNSAAALLRNTDTLRVGGRVEEYFKLWEPKGDKVLVASK
jgi:hypothetical protein